MKKAVDIIDERAGLGIRLGLENIDRLMAELGSPHLGQKYIHVGGTNGKGSVSSFIAEVLREEGYKVGKFSSPKLVELSDMYGINGIHIEAEKLEAYAERLSEPIEKLEKEGIRVTEFELQTAIAFLYFKEEGCDYSVIEVGLGGSQDATNIISPLVSVITSIAYDHSNMLGNSLLEIAGTKAGIIKENTPVCGARQEEGVDLLLKKRAEEVGAPYYSLKEGDIEVLDYSLDKTSLRYQARDYEISQLGTYQVNNAALALLVLDVLRRDLGVSLSEEAIRRGLKKTYWGLRFEIVSQEPYIVLDGAHNEAGIRELKKSLELYFKGRRLKAIFAVMRDKAISAMLREIGPLFEGFMLPDIKKERALSNTEIGRLLEEVGYQGSVSYCSDLKELTKLVKEDQSGDVFVAFGSLYYLEELKNCLKRP